MLKKMLVAAAFVSFSALAYAAVSSPDVGPHGFAKNYGPMRLPPSLGGSDPSVACKACGFLGPR